MKKLLQIVVILFLGLVIVGCGGGDSAASGKVSLDNANYSNAIKAMTTTNKYTVANLEAIAAILKVINDGSCDSGTFTQNGTQYTFDNCMKTGAKIDGSLNYNHSGDILDFNNINITLSGGGMEMYYENSTIKITYQAGSDSNIKKIEINVTGYFEKDGSVAIRYKGYKVAYDKSSGTGTHETYNGDFILYVYSDKWLTVQTDSPVILATGDGCPSGGILKLIGEDSTVTVQINVDFTLDIKLNGEDKPSLVNCDAIGEYTL